MLVISNDYVVYLREPEFDLEIEGATHCQSFTQKDVVDYKGIFSPIFKKDSFRIIMALVAYYDLELHQMYMKTTFLNGNLKEEVYMAKPKGFPVEGKKYMVCKLKKSISRLKQASQLWYLISSMIPSFPFDLVRTLLIDVYIKK